MSTVTLITVLKSDKKAVLSQGKPHDTFWHHWKADERHHSPYIQSTNAGAIS